MQMQALQAASEQAARAASTVASLRGDPVGLASVIQHPKHSTGVVGKVPVQELVVLPISAVEAGLLPSNQGILTTAMVAFLMLHLNDVLRCSSE